MQPAKPTMRPGLRIAHGLCSMLIVRAPHKRGRFSRPASVLFRSLYTLVLGLGGWFTGLIIVLVTLPTLPLDSELMAVLSIGTPIGLGTYLAWVNRDRPARATTFCRSRRPASCGKIRIRAKAGYRSSSAEPDSTPSSPSATQLFDGNGAGVLTGPPFR
jgi:hypothetical protein